MERQYRSAEEVPPERPFTISLRRFQTIAFNMTNFRAEFELLLQEYKWRKGKQPELEGRIVALIADAIRAGISELEIDECFRRKVDLCISSEPSRTATEHTLYFIIECARKALNDAAEKILKK